MAVLCPTTVGADQDVCLRAVLRRTAVPLSGLYVAGDPGGHLSPVSPFLSGRRHCRIARHGAGAVEMRKGPLADVGQGTPHGWNQ